MLNPAPTVRADPNLPVRAELVEARLDRPNSIRPTGLKADTMLRMQTAYDLAVVRTREWEIVVDRPKALSER